MSRKPVARDRLLEAFQAILVDDGERAATLDAVAARAGVSKGGLLYHFANRGELVQALLEHMRVLGEEDCRSMAQSPEGAARQFLRNSVWAGSDIDLAIVAVTRLAQGGDESARHALQELKESWYELLLADLGEPAVANAVLHMGDGLYYNASIGWLPANRKESKATLEQLLGVLERLRPAGSA
ncbi:TetR/AcrR family transcriptional regulator [Kocuria sp. JC486]|uniref:TetR/AcrR family transcriptional regulator n=1 Tax=Kocuria soli TaxID=2485125 RepID=A0A3N3ZQT5_9MICC|nr:TetR/AcrR family transcriptional regulator [Kocuria soli]NHU86254.1 TetR/AcrR family transcriptional regulator [Kocuria sp. JC486]ROZ63564.1 TetR/AcrR family transcriptional regulator [Kocuria soli]